MIDAPNPHAKQSPNIAALPGHHVNFDMKIAAATTAAMAAPRTKLMTM
jgi:hypothetical protein